MPPKGLVRLWGLLQGDACTLCSAPHLVALDLQQPAVHRVGDGLEQLLYAVFVQQAPKAPDFRGVARLAGLCWSTNPSDRPPTQA